jgi:hypothetical protein
LSAQRARQARRGVLLPGAPGLLSALARRTVAARVAWGGQGERRFATAMDYAGGLAITLIGGARLWTAL